MKFFTPFALVALLTTGVQAQDATPEGQPAAEGEEPAPGEKTASDSQPPPPVEEPTQETQPEPEEEPEAAAEADISDALEGNIAVPSPSNELRTRLSGRWRNEIFLTQRSVMHKSAQGEAFVYDYVNDNVFPFYSTIELRADEIWHKGLSLHFQGWAGLDLADVYFDQRFVADPTYLYLQFNDYGFNIKAGRQMIYSGATRGLHLDGLNVAYQTPFYLGLQVLGGWVVTPEIGPEWYRHFRDGKTYDDPGEFGMGFSRWDRHAGNYAVGGRIFYRMTGTLSAGVSILQVSQMSEVAEQVFGADLDFNPTDWLGVFGNALVDIPTGKMSEANAGFDVFPLDWISVGANYRHADPTLYLSHMSIFSVFSQEKYDSVGGDLSVEPMPWLGVHAGYHQNFYRWINEKNGSTIPGHDYDLVVDKGYDLDAGVKLKYDRELGGMVRIDFRRFAQSYSEIENYGLGMSQLRLGAVVPLKFISGLRLSANAYLDLYDEAQTLNNADDETAIGFLGDLGAFWQYGSWQTGGSVAMGITPFAQSETRGMVKVNYNFDWSFSERRQP